MHFVSLDIAARTDKTAAKRRAILLSSLGNEAYRVLKDVSFPNNPTERNYEQLTKDLKKLFKLKWIAVAECFCTLEVNSDLLQVYWRPFAAKFA